MIGIYKITNKINGHAYIGQSVNIHRRWYVHKNYSPTEKDYPLYKAFRKYGLENFSFEIIEECLVDELNQKEIYWINYYNTFYNGYNQNLGGQTMQHSSKLLPKDLENIINDLTNSNLSGIELGEKYNVSDQTISDINCGKIWHQDSIDYPIRKPAPKTYCVRCGKEITKGATYCKDCWNELSRKVKERPNPMDLAEQVYQFGLKGTAIKYGVSDHTISKWCKACNLPYKIVELRNWYRTEILKIPVLPKNKPYEIKEIYQIDTKTKEIIALHPNAHSAGRSIGNVEYRKHISEVCKGKRKTAYGYIWKYKDDIDAGER